MRAGRTVRLLVTTLALCAGRAGAQEEAPGIDTLVARYEAAEDPDLRMQRLEALAARGGADAPAEERARVAGVLAGALDDDSRVVQGRAVELLALSPEREIVMPALLAGVRRHDRELKAFWKEQRSLLPGPSKAEPYQLLDATLAERKKALDEIKAMNERMQAALAHFQANEGLIALTPKYRAAFTAIPDERSIDGLAVLLDGRNVGPGSDSVHDALIAFGTSRSITLCAAAFPDYEQARKELERDLKERERERPRKVPDSWRGTGAQWKERERWRIEMRIEPVREKLAALDAWAASLQDRLARFAAAKDLAAPPRKLLPGRSWRSWAAKVGPELPASLND